MNEASVVAIRKRILLALKSIRRANGITQSELARSLKLEQSALSRIENQKQDLSMESWIRFCLLFQLNPDCVMNEGRFQKEMERQSDRSRSNARILLRK